MITEEEIRKRAADTLLEMAPLEAFATSERQRRVFREAREHLTRAVETSSEAALRLGSYVFASVSADIREVQDGKCKGEERAANKRKQHDESA